MTGGAGTPAVSVIVPVYNSEPFLAEAIRSILRQGCPGLEIIVVNDGSTDRSEEIARGFPQVALTLRQENSGPSAARNRGIERSRAEIVTFLDADDLWPEGSRRGLVATLAENPQAGVVQGLTSDFWPPDARGARPTLAAPGRPRLSFNVGGAVFRRQVFDRVGLFDESLRYGEDLDFLFRVREHGVTRLVVERVAVLYRRHKDQLRRDEETKQCVWPRLLKKSLERQRNSFPGR